MRSLHPVGDRAVIVDCDDLDGVLALHDALAGSQPGGIVDIVPAARTVLVSFDPAVIAADRVVGWIRGSHPIPRSARTDDEQVTIEVEYAGEDLREVAALVGMGEREVVDLHTASVWRVAFVGFAPGFGYLVTDHSRLEVPRRSSPRTAVPAGSVALAGEFTGVYPRSSPGGWQLIGQTETAVWDEAAAEPAMLVPGRVVRFREAS